MRGRRPAGPAYVDQLDGSAIAKERLKVVLETIAGTCRVQEACRRLGICEQRFHQLRQEALEAALAGIEPGTPGRRPHTLTPAEDQVRDLQEQLADQRPESGEDRPSSAVAQQPRVKRSGTQATRRQGVTGQKWTRPRASSIRPKPAQQRSPRTGPVSWTSPISKSSCRSLASSTSSACACAAAGRSAAARAP